MKRKIWSLLLAAALTVGLAAPALAESAADARLAAVTAKVKDTLSLDTEAYDSFYGEPYENELAPTWSLEWSNDAGSLYVTATEEGKILSYRRSDYTMTPADSDRTRFPTYTREETAPAVRAFLDKVLEQPLESAQYEETGFRDSIYTDSYTINGSILLNGLPSPLSFWMRVDANTGEVVSFSRDDLSGRYFGGVPSAAPKTTQADAAASLASTLSLRLEYVWDGEANMAVLRYLANPIDEFYVDAQTGELVNLTELRRELVSGGRSGSITNTSADAAEAPAPEASRSQLTTAELEGVAKLEGVLSKEELDAAARKITELGLSAYTLADVSYSVERWEVDEAGEHTEPAAVTAHLTYTKSVKDGGVYRRYVTLDGRAGEFQAVHSSFPWVEDFTAAVKETKAQQNAESFLKKYAPDQFSQSAPYESPYRASYAARFGETTRQYTWIYAQQHEGYFYAVNTLSIGVDASDGSISSYAKSWDDTVKFDSADNLISQEKALEIYAGTFDAELRYMAIPQKLDLAGSDLRPLLENLGHTFFYALKLGYQPQSNLDTWFNGIDAKTGEIISGETYDDPKVTYTDMAGHWVEGAAAALARFNIGWAGEKLNPDQALTQLDMLTLLRSPSYGPADPTTLTEDEIVSIYRWAENNDVLDPANQNPTAPVSRLEMVKLLLNRMGHGPIARLEGIYKTSFADSADIPAADIGYAALAQGLGLVAGGSDGAFAPSRATTRAEALTLLYRYLGG